MISAGSARANGPCIFVFSVFTRMSWEVVTSAAPFCGSAWPRAGPPSAVPQVVDVRYVFLVGGFAESKALQHRVKNELETDARRVIVPLRPGLAELGAVELGADIILITKLSF